MQIFSFHNEQLYYKFYFGLINITSLKISVLLLYMLIILMIFFFQKGQQKVENKKAFRKIGIFMQNQFLTKLVLFCSNSKTHYLGYFNFFPDVDMTIIVHI